MRIRGHHLYLLVGRCSLEDTGRVENANPWGGDGIAERLFQQQPALLLRLKTPRVVIRISKGVTATMAYAALEVFLSDQVSPGSLQN